MTVGIYSFPKSGNTWMRYIIGKALGADDIYAVVPDIYTDPIWDNPVEVAGRPTIFYKSHSQNELKTADGREVTNNLIVYIVRHPLDVFLSQLNYVSDNVTSNANIKAPCISVDDVVARGDLDLFFGAFCVYGTLQPGFADAGSWFDNALKWKARAENEPDRVMIIRYEDIMNRRAEALYGFADRLGIPRDHLEKGFADAGANTRPDGKFFWKQKAEHYKEALAPGMAARFQRLYGAEMEAFGYRAD